MNFISNSIKFTPSGYIDIIVDSGNDNSTFKLTIKDTGLGMNETIKHKLF